MIRAVYQSMFVSLSALLLAVLFVLQPTQVPEVKDFQTQVRQQFVSAAQEVFGHDSVGEPFVAIWEGVNNFYNSAATESIALMQDDNITNLALMFDSQFLMDNAVASAPQIMRVAYEQPLVNIVPVDESEILLDPYFNEDLAYVDNFGGVVAGESIDVSPEAAQEVPLVWMTVNDSITGYPYCVGIFNGTINSYPGACALDTSQQVYEN